MEDRINIVIREEVNKLLKELTGRKQRNHSHLNPLSLFMSEDVSKNRLVEGLVRTFPLEKAKEHFVRYMGVDDDCFQIVTGDNGVKKAVIYLDYDEDVVSEYKKAMSFYGYYLAATDDVHDNGDHVKILFFEPKFQETKVGFDEKYFMHVTPLAHKEKILRTGLCPRASSKKSLEHPDNVHLMGGVGKTMAFLLASMLYKDEKNCTSDGRYVIFFLNRDKVLENAKLVHDPNYVRGYVTTDNIPPDVIEDFEEIDVKDKRIG